MGARRGKRPTKTKKTPPQGRPPPAPPPRHPPAVDLPSRPPRALQDTARFHIGFVAVKYCARSRGRVVLWEFWRNPAPDAGVEAQKQTARGVAPRAVQTSFEP